MKWWAAIIAVVCGAELVVAAAIGGAGIGVFFGLEGAFVAALAAATLAFSVRWRLAGRRRSGPTGVQRMEILRRYLPDETSVPLAPSPIVVQQQPFLHLPPPE